MDTTTRMILLAAIMAAAALAPAAVCGQGGGETVVEVVTGVSFPAEASDGMKLLGTGVRRKLVFNVYAAALYVPGDKLAAALDGKTDEKSLYHAIIYGVFPKRMLLHFVRDVGGDKVKEAFRLALESNMAAEDLTAEKENLERFYAGCDGASVKSGEVFEFTTSGSRVTVLHGGRKVFSADSVRLARGMWMGWFGAAPVCATLRSALVSRAGAVLR